MVLHLGDHFHEGLDPLRTSVINSCRLLHLLEIFAVIVHAPCRWHKNSMGCQSKITDCLYVLAARDHAPQQRSWCILCFQIARVWCTHFPTKQSVAVTRLPVNLDPGKICWSSPASPRGSLCNLPAYHRLTTSEALCPIPPAKGN